MNNSPSPIVERRSRRIGPVDNTAHDVPPEELNDDEEERNRTRKQIENDIRINHSSSEKRLSASEKSLSEHFHSCIQLAAENKINAKNAFSLKLIDLLHTMLTSKKKPIHDFTEVTSSLDAGVKIYSYRVDNVHLDTMKMATTICSVSNKGGGDAEHDNEGGDHENDSTNEHKKKKYKKTKTTTLAANPAQINRDSKQEEYQGVAQDILTNEGFITSSAIFDNSRLCWHLNVSSNFWQSSPSVASELCDKEVAVELPVLPEDALICPSFKDFNFKGEIDYNDISISEKISNVFDFDPVPCGSDQHENIENASDDGEDAPFDEPYDAQVNDLEDSGSHAGYMSTVMSSSNFVSDISKLIASEKSDYCYFNTQLLKRKWNIRSMGHWNPFKKRKESEIRHRSQKKELLDFDNDSVYDIFEDESQMPLTITTTTHRDKFLITPETHFNLKKFFRLKTWHEMYVIPSTSNEEQPSDLEETINDYDYNNPNDSQHFIPDRYEDDYMDTDDGVPNDVHDAMERNTYMERDTLIGDNLVEIPNKVSKIELPYLVKDKSVDMKKLKGKIWQRLDPAVEREESASNHDVCFSELCEELITGSKSNELSVPILFNAILQLANDKNLFFKCPTPDLSDFYVLVTNEPPSAN